MMLPLLSGLILSSSGRRVLRSPNCAQHTAQDSTAQDSTVHGTAQHSTTNAARRGDCQQGCSMKCCQPYQLMLQLMLWNLWRNGLVTTQWHSPHTEEL
jgi:hypothetical protein